MKPIFCAKCQLITPHKGSVDGNGEFLFECQNEGCDRFVKFPADTNPEDFSDLLQAHHEANAGQVSVEAQEAVLKTLLNGETVAQILPTGE